jgi:ribosomal protein S18 acetylase RimI-like enzyme
MPRIRAATIDDETFLLRLTAELAAFPIPPWRTADEIARVDHPLLTDALYQSRTDMTILVAEAPLGTPAGYVMVSTHHDPFLGVPHAHVEILAVDPRARGQGLASRLMNEAESWARASGFDRITLNVFFTNQAAREIYQHLGYSPETIHYLKLL